MTDLSDLRLDKPPGMDEVARRRSLVWPLLLLLAVIAVAVGAYFVRSRKPQPAAPQVRVENRTAVPQSRSGPEAEPGDNIPLAPLDDTDPIVRELVGRLSSHPTIVAWLATDQLIRHFTVSVVNVADGRTPAGHLAAIKPRGEFQASGSGETAFITARSYARFDPYADTVASLDARAAARVYATLKPRIQDAYTELGYPNANFDIALERAIVELLQTPVIDGRIAVKPSPVRYVYVDNRLESLSSAQRQLLRMGPRNVRLVQAKLREMAPYLGIAPEKLPAPADTARQ